MALGTLPLSTDFRVATSSSDLEKGEMDVMLFLKDPRVLKIDGGMFGYYKMMSNLPSHVEAFFKKTSLFCLVLI